MATATKLYDEVHDASEALVMAHLGMVKRVALHLKARIPPFMELDELMQVGMIGLLEAARAFDPTKGIEFESFALSRVRGAILDEVRQLSYLPRSAVAFNKSENEAINFLASELGRTPTQSELAEHLGDDLEEFQKKRGNAKRFETLSMEVINDEVLGIADERSRQPDAIVEHEDFMRAVTDAIAELPERDQLSVRDLDRVPSGSHTALPDQQAAHEIRRAPANHRDRPACPDRLHRQLFEVLCAG